MVDERTVTFRSDPIEVWDRYHTYRGKLAFDVGANGGMVADILAPNFEHVVAFEPCEESYQHLVTAAPPNVTPLMVAVSDHDGEVELREASLTMRMGELVTGASLPAAWGETVGARTVPAVTLDTAVKTYGVPDFIKIDTEGHELAVVHGGVNLFHHHSPRLIIEVHSEENGDRLRPLLWAYDQEIIRHPAYEVGGYHWLNHYYIVSL